MPSLEYARKKVVLMYSPLFTQKSELFIVASKFENSENNHKFKNFPSFLF